MSPKFRPHQRIIVPNFLINGVRMDIGAEVIRYTPSAKVEVRINSVLVVLNEDRLIDYEEYWSELRKKESEDK